jgi:hypothetical protein
VVLWKCLSADPRNDLLSLYLVCDAAILLALHRSRAVADKGVVVQVFTYLAVFIVSTAILLGIGVLLRRQSRALVHDTAKAIAELLKPQMNQPSQPEQAKAQSPPAVPVQPAPAKAERTYLEFDGNIRFPQDVAADGRTWGPERNFRVDEEMYFNYFFRALGPNPIQVFASSQWIYLEPNASAETQNKVVKAFKQRIARNLKAHPEFAENGTSMYEKGIDQWNSVFTSDKQDEDGKHRLVAQQDLENFKLGTVRVIVLIQVPYKDNGKWHYLRTCQYLVPPATIPEVWHFCDYFINSD